MRIAKTKSEFAAKPDFAGYAHKMGIWCLELLNWLFSVSESIFAVFELMNAAAEC